jgi:hypothetical protein
VLHTPLPMVEAMEWDEIVAYHDEAVRIAKARGF